MNSSWGGVFQPGTGETTGWLSAPTGQGSYDYYDPWSSYGGEQYGYTNPYGSNPWWDSQVGNSMINQNPRAAWGAYAYPMMNGSGSSAFDEWLQGQYQKAHAGFEAAQLTNPNMNFLKDYLPRFGGYEDWQRRFNSLSPQERGESYAATSQQARVIPRL